MIEKSPKTEIGKTGTLANGRGGEPRSRLAPSDGIRLHEVEIAGVPLRLKSSHDEQTVKELVALVDAKVREALPLTKTGSIQNASILASLHLAEEFLMLKRKAKVELDSLEAKALKVISELETSRAMTETENGSRDLSGQA
jgi:cell division protein ZapA